MVPPPPLTRVPPDCPRAEALLLQCDRFLADARHTALSNESRFMLSYDAARNAVSALLVAAGWKPPNRAGAHQIAIDAAGDVLGGDSASLITDMQSARTRRNDTGYRAWSVSNGDLAEMLRVADAFITAARDHIARICPGSRGGGSGGGDGGI